MKVILSKELACKIEADHCSVLLMSFFYSMKNVFNMFQYLLNSNIWWRFYRNYVTWNDLKRNPETKPIRHIMFTAGNNSDGKRGRKHCWYQETHMGDWGEGFSRRKVVLLTCHWQEILTTNRLLRPRENTEAHAEEPTLLEHSLKSAIITFTLMSVLQVSASSWQRGGNTNTKLTQIWLACAHACMLMFVFVWFPCTLNREFPSGFFAAEGLLLLSRQRTHLSIWVLETFVILRSLPLKPPSHPELWCLSESYNFSHTVKKQLSITSADR